MNRIELMRRSMGMSQMQLAEKLNVHQTAVSQWENGRTVPNFELICKMAELFDADPVYLMGNSDVRNHFPSWPALNDGDKKDTMIIRMNSAFYSMNIQGQSLALETMEAIAGNPKYQSSSETAEAATEPPEGKE